MIIGDVFDVLATIDDDSVDLALTSPPFIALRSYLPDDHPDKGKEIGQEPTPAEFIDTLLRLTAELERVVTPHGTIAIELGDTYSGSGGAGGDYSHDGLREGQNAFKGSARKKAKNRNRAAAHGADDGPVAGGHMLGGHGWPEPKSACLIPELFRVALAYGMNPLTGEPSPSGRWRVRNTVRWVRPNPPVGALGDKFRPATSDLVIACKSKNRWFDLDAVRTSPKSGDAGETLSESRSVTGFRGVTDGSSDHPHLVSHPAGAPPLDWWKISPGGYSGSHYAVFPPELCVIPIKAMCPEHVCTVCGEPRRRLVGEATYAAKGVDVEPHVWASEISSGKGAHSAKKSPMSGITRHSETIGWSDCGHGHSWRPGVVLDPFGGSGTTGMVATGHGRDAILVDIDERNADLARERIGMFLTVETLADRIGKAA